MSVTKRELAPPVDLHQFGLGGGAAAEQPPASNSASSPSARAEQPLDTEPPLEAAGIAPTSAASDEVEVRVGHEEGAHARMCGADILDATRDGRMVAGKLAPGWTRIQVLYYPGRIPGAPPTPAHDARLVVFEPAPGEQTDWSYRNFYVRGAVRLVDHENNARRARTRFEETRKNLPKNPKE